jgi:hypothetical protein
MGGSGYDAALARLRQVAQLTERTPAAETAIQQLEALIATYHSEPSRTLSDYFQTTFRLLVWMTCLFGLLGRSNRNQGQH